MRAGKARGAVAAALVAAALALTAGCGGDDEPMRAKGDAKGGGHAGRPGASASASPGESPSRGKDGKKGKDGKGKSRATPMVPRSQLKPATGSFTGKEKDYLVGRVPEGMEPAAVLEAGETACARIRSTAENSRKDAISALKAGEIDQAEPAVRHLCPRFTPLLKAAGIE